MNKMRQLISLLVFNLLIVVNTIGSTMCEQTFKIHGKTEGKTGLLFFDVLISGECEKIESHILSLEPEKSRIWSRRADDYGLDSLIPILNEFTLDKEVFLQDSGGRYMLNDSAFVSLPVNDSTFKKKLFRLVEGGGSGDAAHWNRACPVNCKDLPQFSGVNAKLIYTCPRGIYKNYTFTQVIFYPKSNYLVIVTHQPFTAVGGDTNHGMLVFHLY